MQDGKATIVSAPKFASGAPKWITQIADLISREHGSRVEILLRPAAGHESIAPRAADPTITPDPSSDLPADPSAPSPQPASAPRITGQPTEHPLVKHALELFGGRIVDIQPRKQS